MDAMALIRDMSEQHIILGWLCQRERARRLRDFRRSHRRQVLPSETWNLQDIEAAGVDRHCLLCMDGGMDAK